LLKRVFEAYLKHPDLLGEATSQRIEQDGIERTVCDYLSGMTDRYLMEEHERIFSPEEIVKRGRGQIGRIVSRRRE
jgi:dGTPase